MPARYNRTMTDTETIPTTYEDAARTLARWHAALDRPNFEVYAFPDPDRCTVRLIEVSDDFPCAERVWPVTFGASEEFPFRSSVALVTPADWQRILSGGMALPEGWNLSQRQRISPNGSG